MSNDYEEYKAELKRMAQLAKEKLKKLAVTTTLVTASLNPANAQSQENTPNNVPSPPPTEHTVTNPDQLREDLRNMTSSYNFDDFVPMEVISLSPQPTINQTLPFNPTKLDTSDYNGDLSLDFCEIGNFTYEQLIIPQTPKELLKKAQKMRENTIKRETTNPGTLGYYHAQTGNIRISNTWKNSISPMENSVYWHEMNHKIQSEKCGLSSPQTTAINYAKANTLQEKTSSIAENLNLARAISEFNKQGVSTIDVIYENKLTENITLKEVLEYYYPSLANILLDTDGNIIDFSPSNPKYKELQDEIIKSTCKCWDFTVKKEYEEQEYGSQCEVHFSGMFNELPFSKKIKAIQNEDKHYNEVATKILKNVHIGFNETVDLTAYRDIIDTSTITAKDTKFREAELPSRETLFAINDYLISKGITSDKDKDAYMNKAFRDIVSKSPEADITLARLMLTDKSFKRDDGSEYPLEIYHTDGDITRFDGIAFVSTEQSNDYLYQPQPETSAAHGNTSTPQQPLLNQQNTR